MTSQATVQKTSVSNLISLIFGPGCWLALGQLLTAELGSRWRLVEFKELYQACTASNTIWVSDVMIASIMCHWPCNLTMNGWMDISTGLT